MTTKLVPECFLFSSSPRRPMLMREMLATGLWASAPAPIVYKEQVNISQDRPQELCSVVDLEFHHPPAEPSGNIASHSSGNGNKAIPLFNKLMYIKP